jgi:hypothetical protein
LLRLLPLLQAKLLELLQNSVGLLHLLEALTLNSWGQYLASLLLLLHVRLPFHAWREGLPWGNGCNVIQQCGGSQLIQTMCKEADAPVTSCSVAAELCAEPKRTWEQDHSSQTP